MAEIVGAVASVLTLCQAVSIGVNRVIGLYRAPAKIKALQVRKGRHADESEVAITATGGSSPIPRCCLSRGSSNNSLHPTLVEKCIIQSTNHRRGIEPTDNCEVDRTRKRFWPSSPQNFDEEQETSHEALRQSPRSAKSSLGSSKCGDTVSIAESSSSLLTI